jgi:hypothetical protein
MIQQQAACSLAGESPVNTIGGNLDEIRAIR